MDSVSAQNPLPAVGQPQAEPRNAELFTNGDAPRVPQSELPKPQLPEFKPLPLLAVRAGPAPVESPPVNMEQILRDTLTEHATLRRVGEVLSIETPSAEPETELRLPGSGSAEGAFELALPGEGEASSPEAASVPAAALGPGRLVSTAKLGAHNGLEARQDLYAAQREQRASEPEPSRRQEDQVQSSAVASHTGAVQNPADPRRVELPGFDKDPATVAVAEAAFTQAGLVEATSKDELVMRFFEGTDSVDPGPEPRPEGKLGERNVPFSTFA